ncbi:hypothetical protein D3C80_1680530 [compost metagenome]
MILNKCPLGLANRFFNSMQLLCDVDALPAFLDHRDDASQVAVRTLEAFDDCFVALVRMCMTMRVVMGMEVLMLSHDLSLWFR